MPRSTRHTRSHASHASNKLDVMSITVLLVMAIFGGLIGFYIGQSAGANQMLQTIQAPTMMRTK